MVKGIPVYADWVSTAMLGLFDGWIYDPSSRRHSISLRDCLNLRKYDQSPPFSWSYHSYEECANFVPPTPHYPLIYSGVDSVRKELRRKGIRLRKIGKEMRRSGSNPEFLDDLIRDSSPFWRALRFLRLAKER